MTQSNKLAFLDSIRGFAAIYVLIGHARWLLADNWEMFQSNIANYDLFNKFLAYFLLLFKYGHEMVIFFFILSGFVIHLKYALKVKDNAHVDFDFLTYFKRRFFRIYPPFIFAIVLTYLADKVVEWNNFSIYTHSTPSALINKDISFNHSFETLFGNLFFFQGTFVSVYGSNGPLWSLMYEWWFYMLYPLLFYVYKKNIFASYLMVLLLLTFFILGGTTTILLFDKVLGYLFIWWLGVVLADIYVGRFKVNLKRFFPFILLLVFIPFYKKLQLDLLKQDIITSLGVFSFFIYLFYLLNVKSPIISVLSKCNFLADFSYTLYVIHFPILVVYHGLLLRNNNNIFPSTYVHVLISSVFLIFFSSVTSKIIERNWFDKKV